MLQAEGRTGELTLTFVDRDEIAALNIEHMGKDGPTDVLSFPLDSIDDSTAAMRSGAARRRRRVPRRRLRVGAHPRRHARRRARPARRARHPPCTGHDHAEPQETRVMREQASTARAAPLTGRHRAFAQEQES